MFDLGEFVIESNRIEGMLGARQHEIDAAEEFLKLDQVTVPDLEKYVATIQPHAVLRIQPGCDVIVGRFRPPSGGPDIFTQLDDLLTRANRDADRAAPWFVHVEYERVHPFTDGNGRSGRMLWLWMMMKSGPAPRIGFLHTFYYQTLANVAK